MNLIFMSLHEQRVNLLSFIKMYLLPATPLAAGGCLKIFEKFDEASRLIRLCTYLYLYEHFSNL